MGNIESKLLKKSKILKRKGKAVIPATVTAAPNLLGGKKKPRVDNIEKSKKRAASVSLSLNKNLQRLLLSFSAFCNRPRSFNTIFGYFSSHKP